MTNRWIVILEAGAHASPVANRIRALLKIAHRSFRLRCIDVREEKPEGPACTESAKASGGGK